MKKWIVSISVIVIIAGACFWFFNKDQRGEAFVNKTMAATVEKGDLKVEISGSGTIASVYSEDINTASSGEVDEVLFEVDEVVEEDVELVTFTDGSDPITAPADGTITSLDVESGIRLAGSGTIGHLTNYKKLQTVISVDELDISSVKKGQTAEITVSAFPDQLFTGIVTKVAKEGTNENGVSSFEVIITFDKIKGLKIGMSTEAKVLTESKEEVVYVPIEAVQTQGNEKYVTIQKSAGTDEETAVTSKQTVEIGINNDQYIEIKSGVEEGQIVQLPITISNESSIGSDSREGGMGRGMSNGGGMGGLPSGGGGTPPIGGMGGGNGGN